MFGRMGPANVRKSVKDDGVGFNPRDAPGGYGLDNMRLRAEEIGGTLSISRAGDAGADVRVRLPIGKVSA